MKQTNRTLSLSTLAGCTLVLALNVSAAGVIDMRMVSPTPGDINYLGGNTPLIGSNIQIDNVIGLETPLHNNLESSCINCIVNFNSGSLLNYNPATQTWRFNGGGTISVVGGVDFSDNSTQVDIAAGTTLLSGAFGSASISKLTTGQFDFRIAAGSFTDTKHPDLLAYYGLPMDGLYEGGFNLSFSATPLPDNGFESTTLYSGDLVNTSVPVPAALWLLGSGLVALGSILANKRKPYSGL